MLPLSPAPNTPHHVTVKMPTFSVVVPSYLIGPGTAVAEKKSSTQLHTDMRGFSLMKEPGPWLLQQARVDLGLAQGRVDAGKQQGQWWASR